MPLKDICGTIIKNYRKSRLDNWTSGFCCDMQYSFSVLKLCWIFGIREEFTLEFSLNGAELSLNSGNSENLRNHWGMNWIQYKDLLCCLCLCGWVVESLSLTHEILGSNPAIFLFDFNFFVTEFSEFSECI